MEVQIAQTEKRKHDQKDVIALALGQDQRNGDCNGDRGYEQQIGKATYCCGRASKTNQPTR